MIQKETRDSSARCCALIPPPVLTPFPTRPIPYKLKWNQLLDLPFVVCEITFIFILSLWGFHSPPCPNWNLAVSWKYCFPHSPLKCHPPNPIDWIWRWVTRCLSCSLIQLATILPLPPNHLALVPTSSDYNHTILYPAVTVIWGPLGHSSSFHEDLTPGSLSLSPNLYKKLTFPILWFLNFMTSDLVHNTTVVAHFHSHDLDVVMTNSCFPTRI